MVEDDFAARLSSAVRDAGGPAAVSKKSGVAVSTLYSYMNGSDPGFTKLSAIASACSVSLDWLAWGNKAAAAAAPVPPLPILERQIMEAPAHFWSLFVFIRSCQDFYQQIKQSPTLAEVLHYIGPSYITSVQRSLPDAPIEFQGEDVASK
jgi:transcriptional regulator with XRE-family HTH domain